jgi:hypothetical protein
MVRALVADISLRAAPGVDSERLGTLPMGSRSLVVGAPREADGYRWIQIAGPGLPPASGCATFPGDELTCPVWLGWAAAGDPASGAEWFDDDPSSCPDPGADAQGFMMLGDYEAIHCYRGLQLTFDGWLRPAAGETEPTACPGTDSDAAALWLLCHRRTWETAFVNTVDAVSIELFVDPATSIAIPRDGGWVTITGHIDDGAARQCPEAVAIGDAVSQGRAELDCRAHFVVTGLAERAAP